MRRWFVLLDVKDSLVEIPVCVEMTVIVRNKMGVALALNVIVVTQHIQPVQVIINLIYNIILSIRSCYNI